MQLAKHSRRDISVLGFLHSQIRVQKNGEQTNEFLDELINLDTLTNRMYSRFVRAHDMCASQRMCNSILFPCIH